MKSIFFRKKISQQLQGSQEGEDIVLNKLFGFNKDSRGLFVDVGAHHPCRFSNTWMYYCMGWRGINIDPNPGSMIAFEQMRGDDINLEIGVSQNEGKRKFFCYNEPALNGIDNDRRDELKNTSYKLNEIIEINTLPLVKILDCYCKSFSSPNFLNIDVEGLEMEVLKSNNWERYRFEVILVEQKLNSIDLIDKSDVFKYLFEKDYKPVACTGRTVIYKHEGDTIN